MTETQASAVAMPDIPSLRSKARKAGDSAAVALLDRRAAYLNRRNRLQRDYIRSTPGILAMTPSQRHDLWIKLDLPEEGLS